MSERQVILMGGGGHARVLVEALHGSATSVTGITDPGLPVGELVLGVPVLGSDTAVELCDPASVVLVNGMGTAQHGRLRRRLYEVWAALGYRFLTVCHPSAVLSRTVQLGGGVQIMAGAIVQSLVELGPNCVVNTGARIDHDCQLGPHVFIGPGATLCGAVSVGEGALIGAGAVLLPGISVGREAIVGAGAVVTCDVPDGVVVIGNPARLKGA